MLQESVTIGRDHASVADIPAVWRIWRTEKSQQKINPLAGESTILRIVNAMASDREGLPSEKEKRIQGMPPALPSAGIIVIIQEIKN